MIEKHTLNDGVVTLYIKGKTNHGKVLIDAEDVPKLKHRSYHISSNGYCHDNEHKGLHRIITNCPKGLVVDHINHNKLDNRKKNLLVCDSSHNNRSTQRKKETAGVTFDKATKKWRAQIHDKYKNIYLGIYDTKEEAIAVRKKEAEKLNQRWLK